MSDSAESIQQPAISMKERIGFYAVAVLGLTVVFGAFDSAGPPYIPITSEFIGAITVIAVFRLVFWMATRGETDG